MDMKIFCVEYERVPLKFYVNDPTPTLNDMILYNV